MPTTVNKRCVVYILAKRVRSQTVSLKFLWILLNKRYNMLNNTRHLRWYYVMHIQRLHRLQLTICRCRYFGGCNFWKENSSKSKIWYPVKLLTHGYQKLQLVKNWKQNYCDTLLRNMKSHIESMYCIETGRRWKMKTRNSINSDQLCLTSTRHFWKMYRKWKFPNFQIYGF